MQFRKKQNAWIYGGIGVFAAAIGIIMLMRRHDLAMHPKARKHPVRLLRSNGFRGRSIVGDLVAYNTKGF